MDSGDKIGGNGRHALVLAWMMPPGFFSNVQGVSISYSYTVVGILISGILSYDSRNGRGGGD